MPRLLDGRFQTSRLLGRRLLLGGLELLLQFAHLLSLRLPQLSDSLLVLLARGRVVRLRWCSSGCGGLAAAKGV